jgi:predicted ATPase
MTLEHSLTNLETSGIIRLAQMEPELEYLFRHALVQEVTYESMLRGDRRRLHLTIGETIERLFPERLDEFAPLLSHHFLQSENYDKALKYSLLAAEKAIQQYANEEAIIH